MVENMDLSNLINLIDFETFVLIFFMVICCIGVYYMIQFERRGRKYSQEMMEEVKRHHAELEKEFKNSFDNADFITKKDEIN